MVWPYKGVVGNVCLRQHSYFCMCVSVYFVFSKRVMSKVAGDRERERERVDHAEKRKKCER